MSKLLTVFGLVIFTFGTFGQNKMRSVNELINHSESSWDFVSEWIRNAKNPVEVLSCDSLQAKDALFKIQVTTRSPMGAIVFSTGGILIEHGWIRILGSGNSRLNRSLPDWNKGKSFNEFGESMSFLLIADDALGGFFAINAGKLSAGNIGKVYYLAPESLEWESLDQTYTDFLNLCFNGDLDLFYQGLRWETWKKDVSTLDGNQVFSFFPFLWTKEGKDIVLSSRKEVPVEEHYLFVCSGRQETAGTRVNP
jgi:hypothetical protein